MGSLLFISFPSYSPSRNLVELAHIEVENSMSGNEEFLSNFAIISAE